MIEFVSYKAELLPAAEEIFRSNVPDFVGADEMDDMYDFLNKEVLTEKLPYWILFIDDFPAGMCGYFFDEAKDEAVLCWGLLHRNYHKKQLGKAMLNFRIAKIREISPTANVICRTSQVTEGFFAKFGFVTVEEKENYWSDGLHLRTMELKPE